MQPPWIERLKQIRAEVVAAREAAAPPPRKPDPWEAALGGVCTELHGDQERLTSAAAFDHLNIKRSKRTPVAARRLSRVMRHLGWESARWRAGATASKVRGYVRRARTDRLAH